MSDLKTCFSIKKSKKKKVTIDERVTGFGDKGVTITRVKNHGPGDGPIITEINGDMKDPSDRYSWLKAAGAKVYITSHRIWH